MAIAASSATAPIKTIFIQRTAAALLDIII
jgi:hypothetical protein